MRHAHVKTMMDHLHLEHALLQVTVWDKGHLIMETSRKGFIEARRFALLVLDARPDGVCYINYEKKTMARITMAETVVFHHTPKETH